MDGKDLDQLREWLELTNQQFDILKALYTLEQRREDTSPINIQKEYTKQCTKRIERSNLFTIMKLLMDKELIQKADRGKYQLSIDGIKKSVDEKDKIFRQQYSQFQKARENLDTFLSEVLGREQKPMIRFLSHKELFASLSENLKYATEYCVSVRAPALVSSRAFYTLLDRKEYHQTLEERALEKKELRFRCLSDFNFNIQYDRARALFNDDQAAYSEIIRQIGRLQTLVEEYDNLEFHILPYPIALKLFMPVVDRPQKCYIYLPGFSSISSQGAIYINSEEISRQAYEIFNKDCLISTKLNGNNIIQTTRSMKKSLDRHLKK
ncbi:MAG: hypothetical protein V1875_03290 [Candidatus Altiarchaeota archaeon]